MFFWDVELQTNRSTFQVFFPVRLYVFQAANFTLSPLSVRIKLELIGTGSSVCLRILKDSS